MENSNSSTNIDKIRLKKLALIECYQQTLGNVTETCRLCDVSRQSYYDYYNTDADFKFAIDNINPSEMLIDLAESHLIHQIKANDTTAIIFTLKTKGKKRGYNEKENTDEANNNLTINFITEPYKPNE